MSASALFGRYWPAQSPIHCLDSRTKLIGSLVLVILLFVADSPIGLGVIALFEAGLFLIAKIPLSAAARSIMPLLFIAVISALINVFYVQGGTVYLDWGLFQISEDGVTTAAFIAVRVILLLLAGSLLTLTTTALSITDGIEKLLSPLRHIGVPVHEFAFIMGLALKFLPEFELEFTTIRTAQIARGARLTTSPLRHKLNALSSLLVPLFASVLRRADTLSAAMDARCYHGAQGRSSLHPLKFERRDLIAAVCLSALTVLVIVLRLLV